MYQHLFAELQKNISIFENLLNGASKDLYRWKQAPEKWCLLEIICHLYDVEKDDFRARLKLVLESPEIKPAPIFPDKWGLERKYMEQDFQEKLRHFLEERNKTTEWLQSLKNPKWDNACHHPDYADFSAKFYLTNWLAHDYLHIRQITQLKYDYLQEISGESVGYAGEWK